MKIEQIPAVQNWLPYDKILEKGIIRMKDASFIKILKVLPINYNLKSDLEKESILNSYINLFKSTNLNLQILIQSKKEDLTKNILTLKKNCKYEELQKKYIEYIQYLNKIKKSSSKNFYLIIKEFTMEKETNTVIENLQNEYLKIKDNLIRCGNIVLEYNSEEEITKILFSFLNTKNDK